MHGQHMPLGSLGSGDQRGVRRRCRLERSSSTRYVRGFYVSETAQVLVLVPVGHPSGRFSRLSNSELFGLVLMYGFARHTDLKQ